MPERVPVAFLCPPLLVRQALADGDEGGSDATHGVRVEAGEDGLVLQGRLDAAGAVACFCVARPMKAGHVQHDQSHAGDSGPIASGLLLQRLHSW